MNEFEDLKVITDTLQKEVWKLAKEDLPDIKEQISSLDPGTDNEIVEQVESNTSNISSLTTRVGSLETQSTDFSDSLSEVETDLHRIDLQQATNTLDIEDINETITSLQSSLTALTDRVKTLEDKSSATVMTLIYDRESTDASINRGLTNGFYAGHGINHNFKQYKYIKLYFRVPFWTVRYVKTEELWVGDCKIPYISTYSNQGLVISTLNLNSTMSNLTFATTYTLELSGNVAEGATVKLVQTEARTYGLIERIEGYK